jgi:hypothetical protein
MMLRSTRVAAPLGVLAALALAPAAGAAAPPRPLRLAVERVFPLNGARIALVHQRVRFRGIVGVPATGQIAQVRVLLDRRVMVRANRTVRPDGTFQLELRPHGTGRLRAIAVLPGVATARSRTVSVIARSLSWGSSGLAVSFLQHRLRDLRYVVPMSGWFDDGTANAVMAFRKANRLGREYRADRRVLERLGARRGGFRVRYPWDGKHVEADLGRQVLALINPDGKVFRVMVTSSGKPSTPTVRGSFRVYSQTPGYNIKSMLDSNYFIGGYAIHGFSDVPPYPASHGCLRIPTSQARFVMNWLSYGDVVDVYG